MQNHCAYGMQPRVLALQQPSVLACAAAASASAAAAPAPPAAGIDGLSIRSGGRGGRPAPLYEYTAARGFV